MDLVWILVLIAIAVFARRNRNPYQASRIGGLSQKLLMVVLAILAIRVLVNRNDERPKQVAKVDETTMEEVTEATTVEETEATTEETTEVIVLTPEEKAKEIFGDDLKSFTISDNNSLVVGSKLAYGWNEKSMMDSFLRKTVMLLEEVQNEGYTDITIVGSADGTDVYGNDTEFDVFTMVIEKEELEKINFEQFNYKNLELVSTIFWIEDSFKE